MRRWLTFSQTSTNRSGLIYPLLSSKVWTRLCCAAAGTSVRTDARAVAAAFVAVLDRLAARSESFVLLAIDDVQWIDVSSANVVSFRRPATASGCGVILYDSQRGGCRAGRARPSGCRSSNPVAAIDGWRATSSADIAAEYLGAATDADTHSPDRGRQPVFRFGTCPGDRHQHRPRRIAAARQSQRVGQLPTQPGRCRCPRAAAGYGKRASSHATHAGPVNRHNSGTRAGTARRGRNPGGSSHRRQPGFVHPPDFGPRGLHRCCAASAPGHAPPVGSTRRRARTASPASGVVRCYRRTNNDRRTRQRGRDGTRARRAGCGRRTARFGNRPRRRRPTSSNTLRSPLLRRWRCRPCSSASSDRGRRPAARTDARGGAASTRLGPAQRRQLLGSGSVARKSSTRLQL